MSLVTNRKSESIGMLEKLGIYTVHTLNNYESVYMTAKQLYKRVKEDSKSNYNWIAPAHELVRVCKIIGFPREYAEKIKIAILNCFANIESNVIGDRILDSEEDKLAVEYCYNSLKGVSEEADVVRERYLKAVIHFVSARHFRLLEFHHYGDTRNKIDNEWETLQFEKYNSENSLKFKNVLKELHDDYDSVMKAAEAEGKFEEDDKKRKEDFDKMMRGFLKVYGTTLDENPGHVADD